MEFVNELIREKKALQERLKNIEALLVSYGYNKPSTATTEEIDQPKVEKNSDPAYPVNGTYLEQILYVIKNKNRFVHNYEIADSMLEYSDLDYKTLKRRISAVLTKAKKEVENLVNYQFSKSLKDTVWGNKEWLDENGNIKEDYNFLQNKKSVKKPIDF